MGKHRARRECSVRARLLSTASLFSQTRFRYLHSHSQRCSSSPDSTSQLSISCNSPHVYRDLIPVLGMFLSCCLTQFKKMTLVTSSRKTSRISSLVLMEKCSHISFLFLVTILNSQHFSTFIQPTRVVGKIIKLKNKDKSDTTPFSPSPLSEKDT